MPINQSINQSLEFRYTNFCLSGWGQLSAKIDLEPGGECTPFLSVSKWCLLVVALIVANETCNLNLCSLFLPYLS
jgi:hypothetical protein